MGEEPHLAPVIHVARKGLPAAQVQNPLHR
jgi:hypothetical protein